MNKYQEEEEYLKYVLDSIGKEINFSEEEIERLRKEGITLSFEDTKRGEHLNISAKLSFYADKIRMLNQIIPSPYFGRFDFLLDEDNYAQKIYIGKTSVNRDGKFLITDWRAPICSLYYDSNVGRTQYESASGIIRGNLQLKRQINIENSQLIDVVDSNLVTNDELLRPYLSTNADNKMKTIIESIQKEQNQIIRKPISDNIIIQGVAGSGKTSVALHRIAYLIYNLGDNISSTQFLVLGPNDYFLNYISSILPELETEPVDQKTFLNLVNEYLNDKLSLDNDEDNKLKKREENIFKSIQAYKSSLEYKHALEQFIHFYIKNGIVLNGFEIDGEVIYTKEEIKDALFNTSKTYPDFVKACNYFVYKYKEDMNNIYDKLNKKYRDVYINLPKDDTLRKEMVEKSQQLYDLMKNKGTKLIKDYFKRLRIKPLDLYKIFVASLNNDNVSLSNEELSLLQKKTLLSLKKKKVGFEDLPALMYINYVLSGKKLEYKHIVIDEAQDYGMFHFDIIKEISMDDATFSIYGDLAQAIYSYRSIDSWENVGKTIFNDKCQLLNLSKSYRTTIEITNNANKVLEEIGLESAEPVIRHGKDVEFLEYCDDIEYKINKINEWVEKGYKTIAIICKTDKEAQEIYSNLSDNNINVKYISANDSQYNGGIFVLTSAAAKGLEFDAVIVNNASNNIYLDNSEVDMHLLYVACTRSLHEQVILHNGQLSKPFENHVKNKVRNRKKI